MSQIAAGQLSSSAGSGPRSAASPSALTEQAALGAATSILGICLAAADLEALLELKSDLTQIVLTPYLGATEAKRVALAA